MVRLSRSLLFITILFIIYIIVISNIGQNPENHPEKRQTAQSSTDSGSMGDDNLLVNNPKDKNDAKSEIVFFRRRSKMNEKLGEASEDTL